MAGQQNNVMSGDTNLYRTLLENHWSPIVLLGPSRRVLSVNQAAARLLWDMYLPEGLIGEAEGIPPIPQWLSRCVDRFESTGQADGRYEEDIQTQQGLRYYQVQLKRVSGDADVLLGTLASFQDLTERRLAEKAIQSAHDHLRAVLEDFPNPIWLSDVSGRVTYLNRAWSLLTGRSKEEVLASNRFDIVHPEDRLKLQRHVEHSFVRRQVFEAEYRVWSHDGTYHWLMDIGRPLIDAHGRFSGFVGSCYDVTERRLAAETLRRSQAQLLSVLEATTDSVMTLDGRWCITYLNDRAERILGVHLKEVQGRPLGQVFPLLVGTSVYRNLERAAQEGKPIDLEEYTEPFAGWFEFHVYPQPDGVSVFFRDITSRKREEERLRLSEERYALAAQATNDGLWDWDLASNRIYYSDRWCSIRGFTVDDMGDDPEKGLLDVHPEDVRDFRSILNAHIAGERSSFESEHRVQHKDGTWRWVVCRGVAVRDGSGQAVRLAGSTTDITEKREVAARLAHQAYHDALTGLPNRLLFVDRLNHCIARVRRRGRADFAVLYLDMDRFKLINDTLGHQAGDRFLIDVAARLTKSVRIEDTVARMGGDEFAILLEDVPDLAKVMIVAERLQKNLSQPWHNPFGEMVTSASVGIALGASSYKTADEVLRDADIAMYRAKSHGRSRHEVFDPEMHNQLISRLELEGELRQAIDHNEMRLVYQPVVRLDNGSIRGFESLMRWRNPRRGDVSPDVFVPVAEDSGLIVPLGSWALLEACRQAAAWDVGDYPPPGPFVTVNLSARQFSAGDLVGEVRQALEVSGLPATRLRIEITESILMGNNDSVASTLEVIKSMGIKIYLDDFGTGYSSLSYLHRFPIDAVKVDRTFIARLEDPRQGSLVRAILDMARGLEMSTVAEGIETPRQAQILISNGCPSGQGYYFSKPVESHEVPALLRARNLPR